MYLYPRICACSLLDICMYIFVCVSLFTYVSMHKYTCVCMCVCLVPREKLFYFNQLIQMCDSKIYRGSSLKNTILKREQSYDKDTLNPRPPPFSDKKYFIFVGYGLLRPHSIEFLLSLRGLSLQ